MVFDAEVFDNEEMEKRDAAMRKQDQRYIKACRAAYPDMEVEDFKVPEVREDAPQTVTEEEDATELTISVRGASGRTITFVQPVNQLKRFNAKHAKPEALISGAKGSSLSISMTDFAKAIARKHNLSVKDITGPARHHHIVDARSEFAYQARHVLRRSWHQIGMYLNRDHSTAINLVQRYERKNGGTHDNAA